MVVRAALALASCVLLTAAACSDDHPAAPATPGPFASTAPAHAAATGTGGARPAPSLTPAALHPGECFDADTYSAAAGLDLSTARLVDCAAPHQHEVYAVFVNPSDPGAPYPGDDQLAAFAEDHCLAAFTPYTGLDYRTSSYDIADARPDREAWYHGERHVVCALHDADFGLLTGSAAAAPTTTRP